jgi:hypothetical protein
MPHSTWAASVNTNLLRDTWDAEIGLDPVEETKIADWVEQPIGAQKFGNNLYLRKLPALVASTYSSSATNGLRAGLTWQTTGDTRVTAAAVLKYSAVGLEKAMLNRAVEDSNIRNAFRKQLMAAIKEGIDISLFNLALSLSSTVSQADIDDAMVRTGLGQLATNAKGKFTEDSAKLLVVHPTELKNVWNIPAIKEYQIRGTVGAAVNAKMNAYGLIWRESGNVALNAASYYNPLLLKDAWALAWNEKPHILDVQYDGITENYIAVTEYGVCEWFDSSGVCLVTT